MPAYGKESEQSLENLCVYTPVSSTIVLTHAAHVFVDSRALITRGLLHIHNKNEDIRSTHEAHTNHEVHVYIYILSVVSLTFVFHVRVS